MENLNPELLPVIVIVMILIALLAYALWDNHKLTKLRRDILRMDLEERQALWDHEAAKAEAKAKRTP